MRATFEFIVKGNLRWTFELDGDHWTLIERFPNGGFSRVVFAMATHDEFRAALEMSLEHRKRRLAAASEHTKTP